VLYIYFSAIVVCVAIRWDHASDDDTAKRAGNNIITRSTTLAQKLRLHHRYIYQNYANQSQDVFGGYGSENRERLLQIQKKYDPERIFTRLQPGYFQL